MDRKTFINKISNEYSKNLSYNDLVEFTEKSTAFVDANSQLSDIEFLKKFDIDFPFVRIANEFEKKETLEKIAVNTSIIKFIVVISFLASIISAFIWLFIL